MWQHLSIKYNLRCLLLWKLPFLPCQTKLVPEKREKQYIPDYIFIQLITYYIGFPEIHSLGKNQNNIRQYQPLQSNILITSDSNWSIIIYTLMLSNFNPIIYQLKITYQHRIIVRVQHFSDLKKLERDQTIDWSKSKPSWYLYLKTHMVGSPLPIFPLQQNFHESYHLPNQISMNRAFFCVQTIEMVPKCSNNLD